MMLRGVCRAAALATTPEELQAVALNGEIDQRFHLRDLFGAQTGIYLDDFATLRAGDVVVVLFGVIAETETMRSVGELHPVEQMQLLQDFDGAKDGCPPHVWITSQHHVP